jgi:hypothetical protein
VKEGKPVLHNFVWRLHEGRPTQIVREFTVEDDLSDLIALVEELTGNPTASEAEGC